MYVQHTLPLITHSDLRQDPNEGCVGRRKKKKGDEYFTKEKKSLKNLLFISSLLYVEKLIFLLSPFNLILVRPPRVAATKFIFFLSSTLSIFIFIETKTQVIWKMFIEEKIYNVEKYSEFIFKALIDKTSEKLIRYGIQF
jgi:hypothetical protein